MLTSTSCWLNLQEGKSAIFCSLNLPLYLWYSTQLYMMFLTAEFASTIQYPELQILFSVIPRPLWPVSLWWCFISKSVIFQPSVTILDACTHHLRKIFPIFLQHRSLHLYPRMDPSKKSCFSCPVIYLSHWNSPQILTIEVHPQSFVVAPSLSTLFLLLLASWC